jgi:hypothetical protein
MGAVMQGDGLEKDEAIAARYREFRRSFEPVNVLASSTAQRRKPGGSLKRLDRRMYSAAARADNKLGLKGVLFDGRSYRVRFEDGGRSRCYGRFATREDAAARSRAVQAARASGDAQALARLRSRRRESAAGCKGVQFVRGRYRVRFRIGGRLCFFGSFATYDEAAARANQVQAARSSGGDAAALSLLGGGAAK